MISNTFLISKSILFWINLVLSVFLIGPIAFLLGLFSYRLCLKISKIWCKYNLFFLKYFCSLSFILSGPALNSSQLIISKASISMGDYISSCICSKADIYFKERAFNDSYFWLVFISVEEYIH